MNKKLNPIEELDVINLYISGLSSIKIASIYSVSKQTILKCLSDNNIKRRELKETKRKYCDETVFDKLTEESLYWLGFLFADGSVSNTDKRSKNSSLNVQCTLKYEDMRHLEKLRNFYKSEHSITIGSNPERYLRGSKIKETQYCKLSIASDLLGEKLRYYGITSPRKEIHYNLIDSRHFWRGVMDGDGSLYYAIDNRNMKKYPRMAVCGNTEAMEQFRQYVMNNTTSNIKLESKGKIDYVKLSGKYAVEIAKLLYQDSCIYLDRKYELYKKFINS